MSKEDVIRIHSVIQYLKAIGSWGMAETLEKMLKESSASSQFSLASNRLGRKASKTKQWTSY